MTPQLIDPEEMHVTRTGPGWREITLADAASIGSAAMVARRWELEPGAQMPERTHGPVDQLLYVIRGSGWVSVASERFPLAVESVVWLEAGDRYLIKAGPEGLEILQGYAPGG